MKKMKIQMDKFPHLKYVKDTIDSIQKEIEVLNKRKRLGASERITLTSEYQQNELDLVLLRTEREISKLFKTLNDQENHFKVYKQKLTELLDEVSEHFDSYIKEQRKLILKDEKVRLMFAQFKPFDFDENWEAKIQFYANLKELEKQETTPTEK